MSNPIWVQIKRINRKLAKQGYERLRARGEQMIQDLGEYFVLDISLNIPMDIDVDLDGLEAHLIGPSR